MNFDNIPEELRQMQRWVCWKLIEREGKPTKIPINPSTGENAMSNKPGTWSDYWTALDRMTTDGYSGIGFMFHGEGIVGVDIDHCKDADTGKISELAVDIIGSLDSYTEISQSGTGIHIICKGQLPAGKRRKEPVEMYEVGRFFVMTGDVLDIGHIDVEERTAELAEVHKKYIQVDKKDKNTGKKAIQNCQPNNATDDEIIEKALNAKNGDTFAGLMDGNWKGTYTSASEADLALCNLLAFWTGSDPVAMDRLFRRSGLYREKWGERRGEAGSYGEVTIQKAIADCSNAYTPPQVKKGKGKKNKEEVPEIETGFEQLGKVGAPKKNDELPTWITGPYHDTWNAQRMVEKYGVNIRYNTNKGWHVWNGKYWEEDRQGKVRRMADDTISSLNEYLGLMQDKYGYESKRCKEFYGWLAKARNTGRKDNMIKEAQSLEGMSMLPEDFDKDLWVVNCANGTIDLRTGNLRPHEQKDLITRIVPIEYEPKATAPLWNKFLNEIFNNNKELIDFLQRATGYSMTGSIKEQCMFILHGVGRNGKSTFLDTIRSMLGGYTRNANSSTFMRNENTNLNEIARLQGARFVTTTELEEGERLSESLIKQATGGEPLTARYLYKEAFEYIPEFKLWMGTNHKPKITGGDLGIWRRIRLVPFNVIITPEEMDPELPNKLLGELPGIFNWALEGCRSWLNDGLKPPREVLSATDDYRGEMDALQTFLDECVEMKESASVRASELYIVFENWCEQNGEYKHSSTKFSLKLKERGINKSRTMVMRCWEGIQLTSAGRKLLHTGQSDGKNDTYEQEGFPWEK